MPIHEVFPSPTVKQVLFQVRFPNLFYLESRMGEFQLKVMKDFPKSSVSLTRQILIAQCVQIADGAPLQGNPQPAEVGKVWNFESDNGVELHVKSDSMDLSSTLHKTYNNPSHPNRFRDSIQKALDALNDVAPVPVFSRVGLRYIDDCPIPALDNDAYQKYYNTTLALGRFNLADAEEMTHVAVVRREHRSIRIRESLRVLGDRPKLVLDFDGYSLNIETGKCLAITDELHSLVIDEYKKTIRDPVIQLMRQPRP